MKNSRCHPADLPAWQMQITPANLHLRAQLLARIRSFFSAKHVTEVDVPVLSHAGVTDPYIDNFVTQLTLGQSTTSLYLQTSPEYAMKRMLASGSGCIYYLGKAFRHEDAGRQHNPEFTMLEWYRIGFDDRALMQEVDALLMDVLDVLSAEYLSYHAAFLYYIGLDINTATHDELIATLAMDFHYDIQQASRDHVLQLLFNIHIEPKIGQERPCFIFDFPASQAALAKITAADPRYAHRFEVYFKGLELANGYWELTDAVEQSRRFAADNAVREAKGVEQVAPDSRLIAALEHGLPECAGVALGVDRLFMLAQNLNSIEDTLTFPLPKA